MAMKVSTIYANKDTYVDNANPNTVFGASTSIALLDRWPEWEGGDRYATGFFGFDLSAIDAAQFLDATFHYWIESGASDDYNVDIDGIVGTWAEATLTYNIAISVAIGGPSITTQIAPTGANGWNSIDVTTVIAYLLAQGKNSIKVSPSGMAMDVYLGTKEGSKAAYLVINESAAAIATVNGAVDKNVKNITLAKGPGKTAIDTAAIGLWVDDGVAWKESF